MRDGMTGERGFSVAELIVTVAIIGILAVFASLSVVFIQKERLSSATRELLADLQKARSNAMTSGPTNSLPYVRGAGVRFISASTYRVFTFNDSTTNSAYDDTSEEANALSQPPAITSSVKLSIVADDHTLKDPATIADPTQPLNNVLLFDRFGLPRSTSWQVISDRTIAVQYQGLAGITQCIRITENRIREGSWDGTACNEL